MFLNYLTSVGLEFAPQDAGVERMARCPRADRHSHGDKKPSCSVNVIDGLFYCHSCGLHGNVYQVAKELSWPDPPGSGTGTDGLPTHWMKHEIKERYLYHHPDGTPAYYVCRVEYSRDGHRCKEFPVHDISGHWGIKAKAGVRAEDIPLQLYQLPNILKPENTDVFVCEGEKDVKTVENLGFTATCSPGGAGKWRDSFAPYLKDKQVVVIADNDDPGRSHADQVANSLTGVAASVKVVCFEELHEGGDVSDWVQNKNKADAGEELCRLVEAAPEWKPQPAGQEWTLYDLGTIHTVEVEPLEWIVEPLIPLQGIGFLSGAPKDGKSLLLLDLCIHLAHCRSWLGRYLVNTVKTLYIAREDPLRRLKERIEEINESYGYPRLPTDIVRFLVRERFNLMDSSHIEWLKKQVELHSFKFLVLDVLNRMVPGLDELSAKDMAVMVTALEQLNRDLGLNILNVDHTRKPMKSGLDRDKQKPNPFDLKGSVAKYGVADFMLCLSRTNEAGRLQLYCENKDTDLRPHFHIDVSAKNSGKPKFFWAGDITALTRSRQQEGAANLEKVLLALRRTWTTRGDIEELTRLSEATIRRHLRTLEKQGKAERDGKNRETVWRVIPDQRPCERV